MKHARQNLLAQSFQGGISACKASSALAAFLSFVIGASLFMAPATAFAQSLSSAQAELARAEAQIEEIAKQTQSSAQRLSDTMTASDAVNAQIAEKEAELAQKREVLGKRMSADYKSGSSNILDVLLASSSFEELSSNIYYFSKIAESDADLIAEVDGARQSLEQTKSELDALQSEQESELESVKNKQAQVKAIINSLSDEVKELLAEQDAQIIDGGGGSPTPSPTPSPSPTPAPDPSDKGAAIVAATLRVPSPGAGLCAAWVSSVYQAAGCGYPGGNAVDQYYRYCKSSNRADLKPGMIIAVPSHPWTASGKIYGHVGIYIGNGQVRDNIGYIQTSNLDNWISYYSAGGSVVRWGWA